MGAQPTTFQKTQDVKYGRYTRHLPPSYRSMCVQAVTHAEARFGRPVYLVEIG